VHISPRFLFLLPRALDIHAPLLTASRVNDTASKIIQPEIVFPARPESNSHERDRNGPNSIPIERKGTLAIGSFSFTDSPPNEYGISSAGTNVICSSSCCV